MKKDPKRYLKSITFNTEHFLANVMAINKILGIRLADTKFIKRLNPGDKYEFTPLMELQSKYSTDDIISQLDEYEIIVEIINQ